MVVVGAGLSGLIAARELKKAGKTVIVLEARSRIGGRMYGRKTNSVEGGHVGYVDRGGQWVGPTQYHMLALVSELKIQTFDSYETGRSIRSWNGEKSAFDGDVSNLLKGCTPPGNYPSSPSIRARCGPPFGPALASPLNFVDCKHSDFDGKIWTELLEISEKVPPDTPWTTPGARNPSNNGYDQVTFETWLTEKTKSDPVAYRKWLSTFQSQIGGSGGFEPSEVSLLHMAWTQKVGPQADTPEKWLLLGGAGQIPERLAKDLVEGDRCRIVLNAPVARIHIGGGNVNVFVGNKTTATVIAKAVIVAIPPSLRAKIKFIPELPAATNFGNCSPMGSMSKVHAVYDTAFWREDCLSGSAGGNLRDVRDAGQYPKYCGFIADSSPPGGKPGILTSFIAADRNRQLAGQLAALPRDDRDTKVQEWVLEDFAYYFGPRAKDPKNVKDFVYYPWDDKEGTCGAFTSHLGPNVWTQYGEDGWRKPVADKIFWAGTEASDEWPGYFDGAVKAGKVAARQVCDTLKCTCAA